VFLSSRGSRAGRRRRDVPLNSPELEDQRFEGDRGDDRFRSDPLKPESSAPEFYIAGARLPPFLAQTSHRFISAPNAPVAWIGGTHVKSARNWLTTLNSTLDSAPD
jgi:hypothetical protein